MKLWQKLLFYLVPSGVLILAGQLFVAVTLSTAFHGVERRILGPLSIAIVLFTILVWKRERFALIPAISTDVLFSIWFMTAVFDWEDGWNMKVFPDLIIFLCYGFSGLLAAVVLGIWGPKYCGPYFPLKG